jgi:hypothetical protein
VASLGGRSAKIGIGSLDEGWMLSMLSVSPWLLKSDRQYFKGIGTAKPMILGTLYYMCL